MRVPAPGELARELYRRGRRTGGSREERSFRTAMRADPAAPGLVLSPHLDDAILSCWSVVASARAVNVVNVFAGSPSPGRLTVWDAITGAEDSAARVRERIAEDRDALARAARTPANLTLLDAQYRRPPAPGLAELDAAVTAVVDSASRVYVTSGVGAHPDHLLVRRYGRMLLRRGIPVTVYLEHPYCVRHGWPPWVDGGAPEPNRDVDAYWRSFLDEVPEMPPLRSGHVERLEDGVAAAKLEAMLCYRTQMPALDYAARGVLSDPGIHRYEVSWELRAV
jgi:LmbE family N-acetylglucosaminyl deacetylase